MLSIGKLGIGQERYYLDKVAEGAEEYYSGEGETAGEWTGDAAEHLGLDGEIGPDQLTAILTGRTRQAASRCSAAEASQAKARSPASISPSPPPSRSPCSGASAGPSPPSKSRPPTARP
jgi:conjugative relaxase-like TrwC/TraI family protein